MEFQCKFFSMMVTNASGERSFSKLRFIENELRNRMRQSRLNHLSLMRIENDILGNIDFNYIIHDSTMLKCRKAPMQCSTRHRGTGTTSFV
jgi:hypothetical protein